MQRFLFFLIGIGMMVSAYGQQYRLEVQHYSMLDGMPNRYVHSVMQDQEGFIWLSTLYGLCRFDGHDFKVFKPGLSPLRNSNVYFTYQDDAGLIWVGYVTPISGKGENASYLLDIINPHNFEIKPFETFFKAQVSQLDGGIASINADESNNLWILTNNSTLYQYTSKAGFVKNALLSKAMHALKREDWAYQRYEIRPSSHKGSFWVISGRSNLYGSRIIYVDRSEEILEFQYPNDYKWIDYQGQLWLQDTIQLNQFRVITNGVQFKTFTYPFDPKEAQSVRTDRSGNLWVRLENEIHIYDHQQRLVGKLDKKDWVQPYNQIHFDRVFFDQQNNAWIPSSSDLYKIALFKNEFTNYLDAGDTRAIVVDEDSTLYANQWYLYRIKGTKQEQLNNWQLIGLIKEGQFLYAGAYGPEILQYNLTTGKQQSISSDSPRYIIQTTVPYKSKKTGTIWLGGALGLAYIDINKLRYFPFTTYNDFKQLSNYTIYFFHENKEGLWLATSDGIYLLDETKGIIAHYKSRFPHLNICHIHEDKAGIFWLATKGGGLLRWDRVQDEVQHFTVQDGLSHEVIYAVYEDDFGYLWMPSNYGLMRFNKATHEVNTYLPEDGIPHEEFNTYSHYKAPDGRLFFGGLGGITSFHPKDFLEAPTYRAPFRITGFEKLNKNKALYEDYISELLQGGKMVVYPHEKSFLLTFALLDYQNPKENRYAYRIEGLEKDWNYITSNSIRIGQLPYGHYTLRVKARRANQPWLKQELSIALWVIRPFYLQWWFIGLCGLSVSGLVFTAIRWRIVQLKKNEQRLQAEVNRQTEKLRALDEQKSRFFLNVAHELRTPLTLISSPIDLLLEQEQVGYRMNKFLQSIRKNAQHLLGLIESILDLARLDAKQLQLNEHPTHLYSLIQQIAGMYESYAAMHDIDYQLHYWADERLELSLDVYKFEKILHNLLSNALKFTPSDGRVLITVQEEETVIIIQVADTGAGIPAADLPYIFERYFQGKSNGSARGGMGIGLNIAWEYARLMQSNLSVKSTPEEGSIFSFVFPKKEVMIELPSQKRNGVHKEDAGYFPTKERGNREYTLLVVEDHVEMQELLLQILEPSYYILQAATGKKALEILEKREVHGIITDIMMPEMDGFELVEKVKANEQWQSMPIIVLTAHANETYKLQALRIGVDDYLYKPFSSQELLVRTHNLLVNYQKRLAFQRVTVLAEVENIPNVDQQWLTDLEVATLDLLKQNPDFKSIDVASKMNISEGHLRRKVRTITGLSANEYINEIRLQKARILLENKAIASVSQVAYIVGFSTPRYFTELFVERFGKRPSSYLRND